MLSEINNNILNVLPQSLLSATLIVIVIIAWWICSHDDLPPLVGPSAIKNAAALYSTGIQACKHVHDLGETVSGRGRISRGTIFRLRTLSINPLVVITDYRLARRALEGFSETCDFMCETEKLTEKQLCLFSGTDPLIWYVT